jgi:hypothetical protein
MCKVIVSKTPLVPCGYLLRNLDSGETVPITLDFDFPMLAELFGFQPCKCGETDGSVDCSHKTATQMIQESKEILDKNLDRAVDDIGYFSN